MNRFAAIAFAAVVLSPGLASAQEVRTSPPRLGSKVIRDGDIVEVFVDERGNIYRELRYHGIIPAVRDCLGRRCKGKKRKVGKKGTRITWVGFQQKRLYSRVFIQTNRLSRFTMHKPNPREIVVSFEHATIPRRNDRRAILTREFSSAVERVKARRRRGRTEVVIRLRRPAGYLYKQEGGYLFIDVER